MDTLEQPAVNQLLVNLLTRCIGCYFIDLPKVFKANKNMSFMYQDGDIKIYTWQQYRPAFKQMLLLREEELKNIKSFDLADGDYLKAIYSLNSFSSDKSNSIILERMEDISIPDVARILEGYRWQDEVTLKIEIKCHNGLGTRYDKDRDDYPSLYGNNVPEKLIQMRKLFERIIVRDDLMIPTEPGTCLLRSFMRGEDCEKKDIEYGYHHETIDDFIFTFEFNDYIADLALLDCPDDHFTQSRGETIYKGKRKTNNLDLEEWIVKGRFFVDEDGFYSNDVGYVFTLGIHMTDPTYTTPKLLVKMYYKIPTMSETGYSEEQLIEIWREITNTIRIRQNAFS